MALYRPKWAPGQRSAFWHYDFVVKGVRHKGSTHERKKDRAREVESDKRKQARAGKWDQEVQPIKFSELATLYLKNHAEGKRSAGFYEATVAVLKRRFDDRMIASISPLDVAEFMAARRKDVKPSTANASMIVLKHMFKKAEEWGKLAEGANPARKEKREKVRNARDRYLTPGEAKTLLDSCSDWLRPIVLTALHTGGRRAEVLGLDWSAVDFNAGTVCFRDCKNGDARKIPMSAILAAALRGLESRAKHGAVFLRGDKPVTQHVLREGFAAAIKKAGLDGFRLHDCRHTWATHLAMQGLPMRTLQELGGWRRPEMVQRYAAVTPASRDLAAQALDRIFASPPPDPHQKGSAGQEVVEGAKGSEVVDSVGGAEDRT